jgi:AcrR family transcriptional regulator
MVLKPQPKSWPRGRPPLPQKFVDDHKRERCAVALSEIVHEVGIGGVTVSSVTERAKIARATFYHLFENGTEALAFACELGSRRLREAIEAGAEERQEWQEQVESAIASLLGSAGAEPCLAELCLLHAQVQANPVRGPYDPELVAALAEVIARGRTACSQWEPASHTEELLASGIFSIIGERLWRGEVESLGEQLTGELTALATTPFLPGVDAGRGAKTRPREPRP